MDIPIKAKVICADGPYGQTTSIILKPNSGKVTHVVVSASSFPDAEYLVPIDKIMESNSEEIHLNCTKDEVDKMPIFNKVEFIPSDLTGFTEGPYLMWPYYAAAPGIALEREEIPIDEMAIRRGATVEATDGHVGRVDEFLVNPTNDHISHLVMREGHLWGQKDVTIPVDQIDRYEDNTVYLKLTKEDIEKLPSVPVTRSWSRND
jgi:sporulation protein YlmC with PRC-barrel domain